MRLHSLSTFLYSLLLLLTTAAAHPLHAQSAPTPPVPDAPPEPATPTAKGKAVPLGPAEPLALHQRRADLPTLWIAGDSTAAKGAPAATGWGVPFAALADAKAINVVNGARGGRSSRTFVTEGLWEKMAAEIKKGDFVIIQFGHNDAGPLNDASRARGSIRTIGEETETIQNLVTKKEETVHTYGWYFRKMITDTKARGATPIVLSLTVRNEWKDGKVERRNGPWNALAKATAESTQTRFIDLTAALADAYDKLGAEAVKPFFPKDHTHTGPEGAAFTARLLTEILQPLAIPGLPQTTSAPTP
ncbi:MAG: yesY [Verrucomicrobiales bacterium]|nr:yesY [Verrucomicrobiales bacterium]